MAVAVGQLLRLRGMIHSAATSVEADGNGAQALTQSFARLRGMVRDVVDDSSATVEEFDTAFPVIPVVQHDSDEGMREVAMRQSLYSPQAKEAQALLGQLAGWVDGLLEEIRWSKELDQAD
jgi:hypothetical protein